MSTTPGSPSPETGFQVKSQIKAPFTWVLNHILDEYGPKMGAIGKAIYLDLSRLANMTNRRCFVMHKTLAGYSDISESSVKKYIKILEDLGLIQKTHQFKKNGEYGPNIYTLIDPYAGKHREKEDVPGVEYLEEDLGGSSENPPPHGYQVEGGSAKNPPPMGPNPPGGSPENPPVGRQEPHVGREVSQVGRQEANNKRSLTRDHLQDVNNKQTTIGFVCSEDFLNKLISKAKEIEPTVTAAGIRSHIARAARIEEKDTDRVEERLWLALMAAIEYARKGNKISDFKRWYMTAVDRGFRPNGQVKETEDTAEEQDFVEDDTALSFEDILFTFDMAIKREGPEKAYERFSTRLKDHPEWPVADKEIRLVHKLKIVDGKATYKSFAEYDEDDLRRVFIQMAFLGTYVKKITQMEIQFKNNPNWPKVKNELERKNEKGE